MTSISLGPSPAPLSKALPPAPADPAVADPGGAPGFAALIGGIARASLPAPAGQDLPDGRQDAAAGPGCALADLPVLPGFAPLPGALPGAVPDGAEGGDAPEQAGPSARTRGRLILLDPLALPPMLQMPQPPLAPLPALPALAWAGLPGDPVAQPLGQAAVPPVGQGSAQPGVPGSAPTAAAPPLPATAAPVMPGPLAMPGGPATDGAAALAMPAADRAGGPLLSGRALRAARLGPDPLRDAAPASIASPGPGPAGQGIGSTPALLPDTGAAAPAAPAPLPPPLLPGAAAAAAPVRAPEPQIDTGRNDWMQAMIAQITDSQAEGGARAARIRLLPDALGAVDIRIVERGDGMHVELAADTPQARALLADAQPRLHELAEARGLRLAQSSIDAALSGGPFGQSGQRRTPQEPPSAPPPPRRAAARPVASARADRIA